MDWHDLNLKHLRVFVEVSRAQSISAATGTANMSQPAITQAIMGLERKLNSKLFTRRERAMFPTQTGKILEVRVNRAASFLDELSDRKRLGFDRHKLKQLSTRQLRALIAVAESRSYSEAARFIAVSQPSLYRSAKELEERCGVTIFGKSNRGIDLTSAGGSLYRGAKLAFAEIDQAIDEIEISEGRRQGRLRIGSLPLARGTILPNAINTFLKHHPETRISIKDSPYEELLDALRLGDIDLTIGALRDPIPAGDVVQEYLFDDRLGVYCGPEHPMLFSASVDKHALAEFPWVVARGDTPTRRHFEKFFAGLTPSVNGPAVETNSMATVRHLLSDNHKLALLSVTQAAEHVALTQIKRLPIDVGDKPRRIGVTFRKNWRPTVKQAAFLTELRRPTQTRNISPYT
ncbi:LysR family transcriptional regulator [Celeribacter halophilus]|jgi:DNA-binding transcriptional LysR family regulator|uniref:LysR substrate-binding domain-containing protein n=1 Tax=Celeribacter halophilus TaxID=576117 RepID=UPI0026E2F6A8|nr:LysR substrate-binding domain-containing protein [Celeribacter halophilus]MDO6725219.1 LysR family transcriptional regulator [Celeribacter halophilus]